MSASSSTTTPFQLFIIDTEDDPEWPPQRYHDLFTSALRISPSECRVVSIARDETNNLYSVLTTATAVIITGSHYNVADNMPWLESLCELIRHIAAAPQIRLFGCCFGAQVVAHALGGQCGRNPSGKMVFTLETLQPSGLKLFECHGDCVLVPPKDAVVLASSATCAHEVLSVGPNVLCVQGHPEFTHAFMSEIMVPIIRSEVGEGEEVSAPPAGDDNHLVNERIRKFLYGEIDASQVVSATTSV
eukprot:PhM_4_TR16507/c0_g1_i2/m.41067